MKVAKRPLSLALSAGWLAACSADVSGYRFATDEPGVHDSGANGGAGGSPSDASLGGSTISTGGRASSGGNGGHSAAVDGAATGGVGGDGAGGTGVWPGDPLEVALTQNLSGVTAAAFQPATRRFFLLMPSAHQYVTVDTAGTVDVPVNLPAGPIAHAVFGVSTTDVFFIVGTTLYRQPVGGGTPFMTVLPGSPSSTLLSGSYAGGWFFIGNASGASQALADGQRTLDVNAPALTQLHVVTTDGSGFAFRTFGQANDATLHCIVPGSFALNGMPCSAGLSSLALGQPVGIYGDSVAWVAAYPNDSAYRLNVATTTAGVCGTALTASFGASGSGSSQAVGLIDPTHALVTPLAAVGSATIDIKQAGGNLTRTPLKAANTGTTGFPTMFVVGVETVTHHAVLVTGDIPVLVRF